MWNAYVQCKAFSMLHAHSMLVNVQPSKRSRQLHKKQCSLDRRPQQDTTWAASYPGASATEPVDMPFAKRNCCCCFGAVWRQVCRFASLTGHAALQPGSPLQQTTTQPVSGEKCVSQIGFQK